MLDIIIIMVFENSYALLPMITICVNMSRSMGIYVSIMLDINDWRLVAAKN